VCGTGNELFTERVQQCLVLRNSASREKWRTVSELENKEECVKSPKLNGDIYRWAIRIKALCLRYGCREAVKGWDSKRVSETEQRRRDKLDDVAKGILMMYINDSF
jgi:hypothetical protein